MTSSYYIGQRLEIHVHIDTSISGMHPAYEYPDIKYAFTSSSSLVKFVRSIQQWAIFLRQNTLFFPKIFSFKVQ